MKKIIFILSFAVLTLPCFAQKSGMDISDAVNDAASEISKKIAGGSTVAVSKFSADTKEMSNWLENESFKALSKKNVRLVERNESNMNILNRELDYQYSGAVSDDTIASFGQKLGARYIVYGRFEHFGGYKSLDFRMTDVETFEVVITKSYSIASSKIVLELLGTEMELSSVGDYIAVVNNLNAKKSSVEKEMRADRDRSENTIRAEYQKKIEEKTAEITDLYDGMYSGAKLKNEIANAIKPIESNRDELLRPVAENSRAKFADQISAIENNLVSIVRELQKTMFVVPAESISVELLRKTDMTTETAYFSVSLRSTDKYVNYSLTDRIDPKTPADFKKLRDVAEKTKSVRGEISYQLKQKASDESTFDVVVSSVRIYDNISKDTLYKIEAKNLTDTNGGSINFSNQKGGNSRVTVTPTTKQSTTPAKIEKKNEVTTTVNKNVEKNVETTKEKTKVSSSKSSWRTNEGKKTYWDISVDAAFRYDWNNAYFDYKEYKKYRNEKGKNPTTGEYKVDVNASIPFPCGFFCSPTFAIEPIRANIGTTGFSAQILGLDFEGTGASFTLYIGSAGVANDWKSATFSFFDLKLIIKAAQAFNLEFAVKPANFVLVQNNNKGMGYAPDFFAGIGIPIRF